MSMHAGSGAALPETPLDWMDAAACKDADPELFFGPGTAEAKRICDRCPVRDQCRDYSRGDTYGVWGGESEQDRRARRPGRQPSAPPAGEDGSPGGATGGAQ